MGHGDPHGHRLSPLRKARAHQHPVQNHPESPAPLSAGPTGPMRIPDPGKEQRLAQRGWGTTQCSHLPGLGFPTCEMGEDQPCPSPHGIEMPREGLGHQTKEATPARDLLHQGAGTPSSPASPQAPEETSRCNAVRLLLMNISVPQRCLSLRPEALRREGSPCSRRAWPGSRWQLPWGGRDRGAHKHTLPPLPGPGLHRTPCLVPGAVLMPPSRKGAIWLIKAILSLASPVHTCSQVAAACRGERPAL